MTFALSHSQVVKLLSLIHNIDQERHSVAFRGRLQHFQRLGFPEGVNTGRGRPARYGGGQVLLLALVLEMTQLGLSPERAVKVLTANSDVVLPASRIAAQWKLDNEPDLAMFLWFDPSALNSLSVGGERRDRASESFFYGGLADLLPNLERWAKGGLGRIALLSLSTVIFDITSYLEAMKVATAAEFLTSLLEWAAAEQESQDAAVRAAARKVLRGRPGRVIRKKRPLTGGR